MIPFSQAYQQVMQLKHSTGTEQVPLALACGRILAESIQADRDLPPFNRSSMDGFACRRVDLEEPLQVTHTIAAGTLPTHTLHPGECTRIMTGAPVPGGTDVVVPFEQTTTDTDNVIRCLEIPSRSNIALQGEDLCRGDILLSCGTCLDRRHIGILASCGQTVLTVARQPLVGVIATGDELVEPSDTPLPAQIRNSNSSQLNAQLEAAGAVHRSYGIVKDTPEALKAVLQRARKECDLLLFTGGVSMGDFDHVPAVFRDSGLRLLFEEVRIKPGKPTTVAVAEDIVCFGMPGNPVAVFMVCERLVKPFILQMMGHTYRELILPLPLAAEYRRRNVRRETWLPVRITPTGEVETIVYHGSGHFHALAQADGYIVVPAGVEIVAGGERVNVRLF